jgi:hypothetical protein
MGENLQAKFEAVSQKNEEEIKYNKMLKDMGMEID